MNRKKCLSLLLAVCMVLSLLPAVASAETTEVTDTLNRAFTGVTGTGYSSWTGTGISGAVYAGQSAGGNESIQLRSKNSNSGIVTTVSGGKATKIVVTWNDNTTVNYMLDIYDRNGLLIFHSNDPEAFWDGTFKGQMCKEDTYVYIARYRRPGQDRLMSQKGTVLLLK